MSVIFFQYSHVEYAVSVKYANIICYVILRSENSTVYVTGRIGIQLNVEVPEDTEPVEQLQEGCIWRQARGAATEVSRVEDVGGSSEKVPIWKNLIPFIVLYSSF